MNCQIVDSLQNGLSVELFVEIQEENGKKALEDIEKQKKKKKQNVYILKSKKVFQNAGQFKKKW